MSTPCPALICEPWNPLTAYSTQGGQVPVVPPIKYGNNEVRWCCPSEEVIAFTGTLPVWVTLDPYTNCLVGAANTILANSPAVATAQAQASLNAWAIAHLADYSLTCTGPTPPPPVNPCLAPLIERSENSGVLTLASPDSPIRPGNFMERFTFNGVAGQSVALWMFSNDFWPYVILLDPTLVELAHDDATSGFGPGVLKTAGLTYTIPADGVYTVECSTSTPGDTGAFTLVIGDGVEAIIGSYPSIWRGIYVASTKRMFFLRGYDKLVTANQAWSTVIDSMTDAVIADVSLINIGAAVVAPARPTLFYNPTDDSVWAGTMDPGAIIGHFFRLDPTTGAILEDIPLPDLGPYFGAYVPSVNKVYGCGGDGALSATELQVFNCLTRSYETAIPFGHLVNDFPICKYIAEIDRVLVVSDNDGSYWLVNPNDNTIVNVAGVANYPGFYHDGFYYMQQPSAPRNWIKLDLLTGIVINTVANGYQSNCIEYNPCRDCIMTWVNNGGAPTPYIVGSTDLNFNPTDSVVGVTTAPGLITIWATMLWNPDASRMYCSPPDGNLYKLS